MGNGQSNLIQLATTKLSSNEFAKSPSEHLYICSDAYAKSKIQMSLFMKPGFNFTRPEQASLFILGLHQALDSVATTGDLLEQLSWCDFHPIKALLKMEYETDMDFTFTRHLVPLTMALIRRNWQHCSAQKRVTELYALINTTDDHFLSTYLDCLRQAMRNPLSPADKAGDRHFTPVHHIQLLFPIILLTLTLVTRDILDKYDSKVQDGVADMVEIFEEMLNDGADRSMLGNALHTMNDRVERLKLLTNEASGRLDRGVQLDQVVEEVKRDKQVPLNLWPTPLRFIRQHDNDNEDFREIKIPPTVQEIMISTPANLPGNHPLIANAHWKPQGPERHLDTHFRLLREDFIAPIRNSLLFFLKEVSENKSGSSLLLNGKLGRKEFQRKQLQQQNSEFVNLLIYNSVKVRDMDVHQYNGLTVTVQFDQIAEPGAKKRREFWGKSKRLSTGTLLCFVKVKADKQNHQIVFGTAQRKNEKSLAIAADHSEMKFTPVQVNDAAIIHSWMRHEAESPVYMLEICKVLFESVRPVCLAFQNWEPSRLPLARYLCPTNDLIGEDVDIKVPNFARSPDFYYDLSTLTNNPESRLYPTDEASRRRCVIDLQAHSRLDKEQSEAFVYALCSEISCTQGPPGTGKTFLAVPIVTTLLKRDTSTRSIFRSQRSPILVVCYTNHALDQFLNHLIEAGVSSISRIGGRCSDPALESYCFKGGRLEPKVFYMLKKELEETNRRIKDLVEDIERPVGWAELECYLQIADPEALDSFLYHPQYTEFGNPEGMKVVGKRGKTIEDILTYWLSIAPTPEDMKKTSPYDYKGLWRISLEKRQSLYNDWFTKIREETGNLLLRACKRGQEVKEKFQIARDNQDFVVLSQFQVIGMTTTGAAKYQHLLSKLRIKTVMLEEAAEVLECHVLGCLSPTTEQLIMIGDHLQLRPQINTYNLSVDSSQGKKYALNLSMFERLQEPEYHFPTVKLRVQRRMRPAISQHIRNILYPDLEDGKNVVDYPDVLGLNRNIFFFDHGNAEDGLTKRGPGNDPTDVNSHSNQYEATMAAALVQYLLQQGYDASDIVVLTPYVSQLLSLRKALQKHHSVQIDDRDQEDILGNIEDDDALEKMMGELKTTVAHRSNLRESIRVATVDNFQGEEATIIILSLVRNSGTSSGKTIGFVKNANRINVMLSRAKHGLYILGQAPLFRRLSPTWDQVLRQMEEDGCVGNSFSIYCQKHPNDIRYISAPEDFQRKAINGGCGRPCMVKLERCGHLCPRTCHSDSQSHTNEICVKSCQRMLPCQHPCPRLCSERCGQCMVDRGNITLPCGHVYNNMPCHLFVKLDSYQCEVLCDIKIISCGHTVKLHCYQDPKEARCPQICREALPCGHNCNAGCNECTELSNTMPLEYITGPITRSIHPTCKTLCGRKYACGHNCKNRCHSQNNEACPPCQDSCVLSVCDHSSCDHSCETPCIACAEPCAWKCPHQGECLMPCGIPCTRLPCDERCPLKLTCGHQCPSVCGEICPADVYCKEEPCVSRPQNQKALDQKSDLILMRTYDEIDVDEDQVIALPCGHIFTVDTLDGYMNLDAYYSRNAQGEWSGLKKMPEQVPELGQCPTCRDGRVRHIRRYGRGTHHACNHAAERKFIVVTNKIIKRIQDLINVFGDENSATNKTNEAAFFRVERLIGTFQKSLRNSPLRAAHDAMKVAIQKGAPVDPNERVKVPFHTSFAVPAHLCLARLLYIRVDQSMEKYGLPDHILGKPSAEKEMDIGKELSRALKECEKAIIVAEEGNALNRVLEAKFMKLEGYRRHTLYRSRTSHDVREISSVQKGLALCDELLNPFNVTPSFTDKHQSSLANINQFFKKAKQGTVEGRISQEEKKMIREVMDREFSTGAGHWYQCPNGHPYTIGECGGAMQLSNCPECGARIGGSSHILTDGNQAADGYGR
ncbi:hypothetical protein DFQ28_004319 [Apophysomyces sp. BC1034]|nr:hypothetical protein DFQ30_004359 [Apophysomyces sp. BC1015]KAG0178418.1 hypothetical protein DFQ29_003489 [Apophysomyces sp. BC1021]KAG0188826.1 hypothetical protein DFQ28_004319 [Apophysomyces sp. BC1034]